jgi:hypothetical protein
MELITDEVINIKYFECVRVSCGPGNSVGIATGYGLDGPGSNPGEGEIFRTCPDRPWDPPSTMGTGSFLGVESGRGVTLSYTCTLPKGLHGL